MAYPTLDSVNVTGIDSLLVYVNTADPSFIILFLLCFGLMIFIATYFGSRKLSGQADATASLAAAAFVNMLLVILLKLQSGILTDVTFYISFIILIVAIVMLFLAPKMK
jgi:predicted MFS family arabinose efflux permease